MIESRPGSYRIKKTEYIVRKWERKLSRDNPKVQKRDLFQLVKDVWNLRNGASQAEQISLSNDTSGICINIFHKYKRYLSFEELVLIQCFDKKDEEELFSITKTRDIKKRSHFQIFWSGPYTYSPLLKMCLDNSESKLTPLKIRPKQRTALAKTIWQAHLSTPK